MYDAMGFFERCSAYHVCMDVLFVLLVQYYFGEKLFKVFQHFKANFSLKPNYI